MARNSSLKLKRIGIDTYQENVAFLSRYCVSYRAEDFQALNKIEISANGASIVATLNIVDDRDILGPDHLGLSNPAFRQLGLGEGTDVHIEQASPPKSFEAIRAKVNGETLSAAELEQVTRDIVGHRLSKIEITAFLTACASFMTSSEILDLTRAMAATGTRLEWDMEPVVDKHCIGGVPGNRTSMIVVPIVAAHGLPIPKTSSRAITSPAGTADTMEVLANVDIGVERMRELVHDVKGCIVWGGHVRLSPADDILITVERPLGMDMPGQLVASILSKKIAAGSTHLVIDIPVGPTAKVRSHAEAIRLRKMFEYVAGNLELHVEVEFTDGRQPIGHGIGPVLEARDVMSVLRNDENAPQDLREHSLALAGRVLEFDPNLRGGAGYGIARRLLESGAALSSMERIIEGQGPAPDNAVLGELVEEVTAPADGVVSAIDCYRLARIARLAGAPTDKGAGIDLVRKVGDTVREGEPLYRIHAHIKADFGFARRFAGENHGYTLSNI